MQYEGDVRDRVPPLAGQVDDPVGAVQRPDGPPDRAPAEAPGPPLKQNMIGREASPPSFVYAT